MAFTQTIDYCFDKNLKKGGVPESDYFAVMNNAEPIVDSFKKARVERSLPIISTIGNKKEIDEIISVAEIIRDNFAKLVILGVEGASTIAEITCSLAKFDPMAVEMEFVDNIDPGSFADLCESVNLKETAFLCISKSGTNYESLAQISCVINLYKETYGDGYNIGKHLYIITENLSNPMRKIGEEYFATILNHPHVQNRFSPLTSVGLLPACVAGVDPLDFREGAKQCLDNDFVEVAKASSMLIALLANRYNISVLVPYQDKLRKFVDWHVSLCSESLGKDGKGITAIKGIGVLDQYSQMQLFLDGPKDKYFTFITENFQGRGMKLDGKILNQAGKTLGDVMHVAQKATISRIVKASNPTRIIKLDALNSGTVGYLFMHFMFEVIVAGKLLKVNPFTQACIEETRSEFHKVLSRI
jgi:glucose-6-phosphate isomerase